ncbi:MAG: peptide deformylase [Candidatus Omnitrophica bacterium]|nr:peptide deformylase [Candidatus Omnitrophota bacterium]
MSVLAIRRFPDPILKQPTRLVERIDDQVRQLIESMVQTMRHYPHCVGLAAPQVGSNLAVAVMDILAHPKGQGGHGLIVLVNPRIDHVEKFTIQREGCLSVPDFTANVRRAMMVRVKAQDETGAARVWRLEGFEAIVAQHEVDHLDGKLFLDRVANLTTDLFRRKTYL